jgi:glycosyltransferase involved in cell wall biosynthesis
MKVLQVVDTLGVGGAETWLMEVLRLWAKTKEAEMDFLLTSGGRGVFDDEAIALGARLHYVQYGKRALPAFRRSFIQVLREGKYSAVHDHQDYSSGWHFFLASKSELPAVRITHVHNPSYQIANNYGVNLARRLTALAGKHFVSRFATHIAGTSRQILSEYGFDAPTFNSIPKSALHCGFDPSRFSGDPTLSGESIRAEFAWKSDAKIILFAGRIDQSADRHHPQNHKNSAFAIDVGIAAARQNPRIHLLLAGQPSSATTILESRVADAGLTSRIKFLGVRKDIEQLMLGSDLLLFPSRGEGLGMVAVEAQAAGLPVLASDAVPRECVVVPGLVSFLPITEAVSTWVAEAGRLMDQRREITAANDAIKNSAFALKNSARAMKQLYLSGHET